MSFRFLSTLSLLLVSIYSAGQIYSDQEMDAEAFRPWIASAPEDYVGNYHFGFSEGEYELRLYVVNGEPSAQLRFFQWREIRNQLRWVDSIVLLHQVEIEFNELRSVELTAEFALLQSGSEELKGLILHHSFMEPNREEFGRLYTDSDFSWIPGDFPQASYRHLEPADLEFLTAHQMKIMRNEIFARYGYQFSVGGSMNEHFNRQAWYIPLHEQVDDLLTSIEKRNIAFIQESESRLEKKFESAGYWVTPASLRFKVKGEEGMTLSFTPDSSNHSIAPYWMDKTFLDSLDAAYDNSHRLGMAIESYMRGIFPERFNRIEGVLLLRDANREWFRALPREMNEEADVLFHYYFEEIGYYSAYVQWFEGSSYRLISDHSDEVQMLIGRPYLSPDKRYLASVNYDIDAGYSPNGIEIYEHVNGQWVKKVEYRPERWGPFEMEWISDSALLLHCESYRSEGSLAMVPFTFFLRVDIEP